MLADAALMEDYESNGMTRTRGMARRVEHWAHWYALFGFDERRACSPGVPRSTSGRLVAQGTEARCISEAQQQPDGGA